MPRPAHESPAEKEEGGGGDREQRIDALLSFQRARLAALLRNRARIARDVRDAEARAARAADALSAARALAAARAAGAALHTSDAASARTDGALCGDSGPLVVDADSGTGDSAADVSADETDAGEETEIACDEATPVGVLYSAFRKRFEAPRQSFVGAHGRATLVLPGRAARPRARAGERLVLVYWLDRNAGHWREFVRPPRRAKSAGRIGMFATRAPNRPTPVGLSLCVVDAVEDSGEILRVSGVDVLDETPVLSVRHYDPHQDAFPDASAGWLQDADIVQPLYYDEGERNFEVVFAQRAASKIAFIDQRSAVDVHNMVRRSLARGGRKTDAANAGVMPVGAFRVLYEVAGMLVTVVDVQSGMRDSVCEAEAAVDPEALLHQQFKEQFL